jgi:hypothetical protein
MSDLDLDAIEKRADVAHRHVVKLCSGEERWTMRIPAQPDRDSDLVIGESLKDVPVLAAEMRRLQTLFARTRQQLDDEADRLLRDPEDSPTDKVAVATWLRRVAACPTCSGPTRRTTGMVCEDCGTDYEPSVVSP